MKYLYESHLGGLYASDEELDYDSLYCSQCGDSDWPIGTFENIKDFWELVKADCDIDGSGGIALAYLFPIMIEIFDLPDVVDCDDGYCSYSDKYILARIEELIKEE